MRMSHKDAGKPAITANSDQEKSNMRQYCLLLNPEYQFAACNLYELSYEKTCFMLYANNKNVDKPAHPHSLISVFVIPCLDNIIPIFAISKISRP